MLIVLTSPVGRPLHNNFRFLVILIDACLDKSVGFEDRGGQRRHADAVTHHLPAMGTTRRDNRYDQRVGSRGRKGRVEYTSRGCKPIPGNHRVIRTTR